MEWELTVIFTVIHLIITGCYELLPVRSKSRHIARLMAKHASAIERKVRAIENYEAVRSNSNAIQLGIEVGQQIAYEEMLSSILPKRKLDRHERA